MLNKLLLTVLSSTMLLSTAFSQDKPKRQKKDRPKKERTLSPEVAKNFTPGKVEIDSTSMVYQLHSPADLKEGKKYPLILTLHGGGAQGSDNIRQAGNGLKVLNWLQQNNMESFIFTPQCPAGETWSGVKSIRMTHYDALTKPSVAGALVHKVIMALIQKGNVDTDRIYVHGGSMGGDGTWDYIQRWPDLFAAAVPVMGPNDLKTAPKIAHMPIWVHHGETDTVAPVANSRNMVAALKKLGSPVKYTEYPGIGHKLGGVVFKDGKVHEWLFKQKRVPSKR
jgi:predicted peptidase